MNDDWVDEEFTVKCHNCGNITVKPKGKHWVFCPHCKTALDIMDRHEEIRWYRGKYKVKVVLKRKKPKGVKHYPVTWLVEALEYIPLSRGQFYLSVNSLPPFRDFYGNTRKRLNRNE